ncbi:ATP-binding cassette domain-containing protein [Streptomyces sp. AC495_CC817]|uniref:ATP-binding cassette domain-containing protein n=1 Tax=Streptomyces sp. AC495_CC817 TaxID=2823900 RepID=UPI001C27CF93|nr:ATP-binding cassette domain-containing protein [Streptomyces sp. AC495_CC817]
MTRAGRLTLRPGPLRAAAGLAALFVIARVVYRVLFNGATGTGLVLLPLPSFRLPAPFSWVVLLGPVTLDGLIDAALSALPIAAVILGFGVLNALFDVSRAFGMLARRGPLRGIARALAVAWSTLPGLGEAVRTVRTAQRLRGEKAGPRMLVPVLERTLERAAAVANGLELRGFGGVPLESRADHPVAVSHAELGIGALRILSITRLALRRGELAVVTGPTGSGKSTLLRGLAGLHDHVDGGWSTGALAVAGHHRRESPPRDTSRLVGVVPQNPRDGFCTDLVRDEIGLAAHLRRESERTTRSRVAEVASALGIAHLLERPVHALSAGEATMVAIAAAVVDRPVLLLVDEPLADLDATARTGVVRALDALAHEEGVCVVVAEHRSDAFAAVADGWFAIADGALAVGMPDVESAPAGDRRASGTAPSGGAVALAATDVRIMHGDAVAVRSASVSLAAGEIASLVGPNGAGKSSLLMALALPPRDLAVTGRAVLVPDAADDLFTRDSVAAECARADRLARRTGADFDRTTAERFADLLGLHGPALDERLGRHPRDLSLGERRCLAIALQLSRCPEALLIDEPTRGLDARARTQVGTALRATADAGTAVLLATHDVDFAASLGARVIPMHDGVAPAVVDTGPAEVVEPTRRGREPFADASSDGASTGARASAGRPPSPQRATPEPARTPWAAFSLVAANLVALAAFAWPFVATAVPSQADAAVPWAALALAPVAVIVAVAALDSSVRSAHVLAYLGVLAAIGTALRIASTGVGGVEAVFILLVLAGRAFGARFGMLLGVATILLSSTVFGGFGPWTPFQMFACAWVGAGAGLLPRRVHGWAEIAMLCGYGAAASYVFGLLLNLWFWPFAIGSGTAISYEAGAPIAQNLGSFLLYSLVTSTAGWDTLRAVTTIVGVALVGRPVLAALRRAKPVTSGGPASRTILQVRSAAYANSPPET